jgi:hypothetical protein
LLHLAGLNVNDGHSQLKSFIRRIDQGAARLNPGLSAFAIILLMAVAGEATMPVVSLWADELETQIVQLKIDPGSMPDEILFNE